MLKILSLYDGTCPALRMRRSSRKQGYEAETSMRPFTSIVLMGVCMRGPDPPVMSKGMFMPVRGVRMSENKMTPSGLNALQGWSETST